MTQTSLEEADFFGVFSDPLPTPATHLTLRQYAGLLNRVGQMLGLTDVSFRFNVITSAAEADGGVLAACGRPPLCAHLVREEAARVVGNPALLPTVVPDGEGASSHRPPRVHCLFCLRGDGGGTLCYPRDVMDLRHSVIAHYIQHMQTRDVWLAVLEKKEKEEEEKHEGAAVLHTREDCFGSESGDELLERAAEHEGRHTCFITSAGTAACPVLVAYCAACDQFAPLATFTKVPTDDITKCHQLDQDAGKEVELQSVETAELILMRLLLACELFFSLQYEREFGRSLLTSCVQEESYIFLATPFLFGEKNIELTDEFESGVLITHSSAVLPLATIKGTLDAPLLCLGDTNKVKSVLRGGLPPYHFSNAVVGFVMQWNTEKETDEKVQWVLQQNSSFVVKRRMVYVEDIDEWVIVRLFCCHDAPAAAAAKDSGSDIKENVCGDFRMRRECSITKIVPLSLLKQYEQREEYVNNRKNGCDIDKNCNNYGEYSLGTGDSDIDSCPYSMESRSVHFFATMTAFAKAMRLAGKNFKDDGYDEPHK